MRHTGTGMLILVAILAVAGWTPQSARAQNTVSVLVEGYVKPIEGRQPMPGVSDDGARHVAGTVVLVRGEAVTLVAPTPAWSATGR